MKVCTKCMKLKPLPEFHKHTKNGLRPDCKACVCARSAVRRATHKEKDAIVKSIWYFANKGLKKDSYAFNGRNYRKTNPGKVNAWTAKRRAAKLQRTPKWLTSLHYQQIELFYDAAAKLTKEFGIKMEVDHIIPLQGKNVSGLHVPWNLQVSPLKDNRSKSNRC